MDFGLFFASLFVKGAACAGAMLDVVRLECARDSDWLN